MCQEAVNDVDCEVEGFRQQMEALVHLEKPIDEYSTHSPFELLLMFHVFRVRHSVLLNFFHVIEDFVDVFRHHQWIPSVLIVHLSDLLLKFTLVDIFVDIGKRLTLDFVLFLDYLPLSVQVKDVRLLHSGFHVLFLDVDLGGFVLINNGIF